MTAYEDDPDRYRTAELRKASHILIKLTDQDGEQEVAQAFEKAHRRRQNKSRKESLLPKSQKNFLTIRFPPVQWWEI